MVKPLLCISLLTAATLCATASPKNGYRLWYDEPAHNWNEALPLGNGRLGAMVFGNPAQEQLQLNEETIWAGGPNNNINPDARAWVDSIRTLIFNGEYAQASKLCNEHILSKTNHGMPYQTFGDLYVNFPGHDKYSNYYRDLSLDSAKTIVQYDVNDVTFKRETFSSFTDNVIIMHLTASKKGQISFTATFDTPHKNHQLRSNLSDIILDGVTSDREGLKGEVKFEGRAAVKALGGKITNYNGKITVEGADEVTLYVSIATNFVNYHDLSGNAQERASNYLSQAKGVEFDDALKSHVKYYKMYADRNTLDLGPNLYEKQTTLQRLKDFQQTHDPNFVATYYRFGRYLLICSSQPGGQPANLQGIWNGSLNPSWDSKYTVNINTEMNYWPSEVCNLSELNEPFFKLIEEVSETGKATAREMYGTDGWALHHNTDIWRMTGMIDGATWGMWVSAGAWFCQHLWQHYQYTGDKDFLRRAYPIMKGAALFYDQTMVQDPNKGYLVLTPSMSPENTPKNHQGSSLSPGCSMDNQLIYDLWTEIIWAADILNEDKEFAQHIAQRRDMLPPFQVGRWGQLQEWMYDWDSPTDRHRHISHLYALYPSSLISPFRTPELFDAARTTLIHRGDVSTGWGMGWRVCFWSRLLDGNHAHTLINNQLKYVTGQKGEGGGTYANLFDAHPPFQIDGNFGCTAGIAEMLMQSYDGCIYLLPALPDAWAKQGEVKGLVARGGFILDMAWKDGKVTHLKVKSTLGGNCRLRLNANASLQLKKTFGRKDLTEVNEGAPNSNLLFLTPDIESKTAISKEAKLYAPGVAATRLFDVPTKKGHTYEFVEQ